MITGKQFTSSTQTLHAEAYQLQFWGRSGRAYGLDFVANQQYVVLCAQLPNLLEVPSGGYDDSERQG